MRAKHIFLTGVSVLALGLMTATAPAQDADSDDATEGMETVVVTGIRASLESAQAIKMKSNQVVDAITATDIGALPDRNVAEALQRVPGVALQRNDAPNDLTRMGSTGTSVFVRGLAWIQTTMNGRDEFSAVNSRTLSFQDVSSDLMSGVDVYKSPTAKMIEGGIGGVVDLKTRKPFDQDERILAFSADLTYGDLAKQGRPSFNGLYSDRWNTKIGEIGFLASVDWLDEHNRTVGINLGSYDCWDAGGNQYAATDDGYSDCTGDSGDYTSHVMAPGGWAWRQLEWKQQRLAANVVLQWRPIETLEITLSAMNTYAHFTDLEHYVYMNQSGDYSSYLDPDASTYETLQYDSKGNWLGGTTAMSSLDVRAGTGHNRTSDLNMNVKWTPSDSWDFSGDIQYVDSDRQYLNMTMYTGYNASLYMTLDVSNKNHPKITTYSSSADTTDKDNYFWYAAMDHMEYNSAHSFAERADATYHFADRGLFGLFKTLDFGVRMQQKVAVTRSTGYNWASIDPVNWGASGVTLAGNLTGDEFTVMDGTTVTANSEAVQKVNSFAKLFKYQKIFGSSVPSLWVPGDDLATMNPYRSSQILESVNIDWGGWTSYAAQVNCKKGAQCLAAYDGSVDTGNAISPQDQNTWAGYVQFNFEKDDFFGLLNMPFDGNIGVRVVRTHRVVKYGRLVMPEAPETSYDSCAEALGNDMTVGDDDTMITSCDDYDTALTFWGDIDHEALAIERPDAVTHNYTNILPSFNFRGRITDQLQFRLGYSESMMQPDFSYTNNDATLSFNWGGQSTSLAYTMDGDPSGYGGNPDLKPMRSVNYDSSLEWYFSPTGNITFSFFYKRISNYIYSYTYSNTSITNPYSGVAMDFDYTTYVNGSKGGIDGWELGYTQFYDMLPGFWAGFGIQANYTKIYNWGGHNGAVDVSSTAAISSANDTSLPMEGMSHDSYNVALLYSKYDIDARLAWNWRSEYLSSTSDSNTKQPVWMENYGQLDASVFYTFFERYKIGVQLYNITGAEFYTDMGYTDYHPRVNWIKSDRKYSLIFRARW